MSTTPGFSSRSTVDTFTQFPQRDEVIMSELQPEPGFSNSKPAEAENTETDQTEAKVIKTAEVEDKAVKPSVSRKK